MAESTVELVLDDSAALRAVDDLVNKLKDAQRNAAGVFGPTTGGAGGAPGGSRAGGPAPGSNTTSTAPQQSGGAPPSGFTVTRAGGGPGGFTVSLPGARPPAAPPGTEGGASGARIPAGLLGRVFGGGGAGAGGAAAGAEGAAAGAAARAAGQVGLGGIGRILGAGALGGPAGLAAGATIAAAVAYGSMLKSGVQERYGMIGRGAALERQAELAGQTGGANIGINSATMLHATRRMGFGAEEASAALSGYYQQIGVRGSANFALSPFAAMLEGIGPGALAAYQRGPSLGAVAANAATLPQALGLAKTGGLTGSQVEDLLGRIAAASDQMLAQGLTLNRGSLLSLAASLGAASPAFSGGRGVEAGTRLSQIAGGAGRGIVSNYGDFADAAIQAWAFSQAKDDIEAMELIERAQQDPRLAQRAISAMGPEYATRAFMGKGFGVRQARALAGELPDVAITPSEGAGRAGALSQAQAEAERRQLAVGLAQPQTQVAMLETMTAMRTIAMQQSEKLDALIQLVGAASARLTR